MEGTEVATKTVELKGAGIKMSQFLNSAPDEIQKSDFCRYASPAWWASLKKWDSLFSSNLPGESNS